MTDEAMERLKEQTRADGRSSHETGAKLEDCPPFALPAMAEAWREGWTAAEAARRWKALWFHRAEDLHFQADKIESDRLIEAGWKQSCDYPDSRWRWQHPGIRDAFGDVKLASLNGLTRQDAINIQRRLDLFAFSKDFPEYLDD